MTSTRHLEEVPRFTIARPSPPSNFSPLVTHTPSNSFSSNSFPNNCSSSHRSKSTTTNKKKTQMQMMTTMLTHNNNNNNNEWVLMNRYREDVVKMKIWKLHQLVRTSRNHSLLKMAKITTMKVSNLTRMIEINIVTLKFSLYFVINYN